MIFSNAHNFIFFHVPKTGGTSLSYALGHIVTPIDIPLGVGITMQRGDFFPLIGPRARVVEEAWAAQWKISKHSPMSQVRDAMGPELWRRMRKIAFVRDPFGRAVSGYRYTCKSTDFGREIREMGFRRFLESDHVSGRRLGTMRPQISFLDCPGELDFLGYLEDFPAELNRLEAFLGIGHGALTELGSPKANATSEEDAPVDLGEGEKQLIREIYAEDFAAFGYAPQDGTIARRVMPKAAGAGEAMAAAVARAAAAPHLAVPAPVAAVAAGPGAADKDEWLSPSRSRPRRSARMERCIVVLGSTAIGGSSIERHFARHRGAYQGMGLFCPRTLAAGALAQAAAQDGDAAADARLSQALAEEWAARDECSAAIIASEALFGRYRDAGRLATLRETLDQLFDRVELVLLARRQDRAILDIYAAAVRFNRARVRSPLMMERARDDGLLDLAAIADRWTGAFGRASLTCRIVGDGADAARRLIADLCVLSGIEPAAGLPDTEIRETPSWRSVEALRLLNQGRFAGNASVREALWTTPADGAEGLHPLMTRAEAQGIVARYAGANERLAREYLGRDDASPFDDDFSDYPEERPHLTPADLVEHVVARVTEAAREAG